MTKGPQRSCVGHPVKKCLLWFGDVLGEPSPAAVGCQAPPEPPEPPELVSGGGAGRRGSGVGGKHSQEDRLPVVIRAGTGPALWAHSLGQAGDSTKNKHFQPWLVWLRGLSAGLRTKGSLVRLPIRAHAWVASQVPSMGHVRGNHTLMFLSLSFSLSSPLSKNK